MKCVFKEKDRLIEKISCFETFAEGKRRKIIQKWLLV